jgi:NAD(P)-dependent dehydrogenase (short-subunit alcohol dehydrogenase family)
MNSSLFAVKDKVILVTGGSRGIGLMIATGFVSSGAKVYISSRTASVCHAEAKRLTAMGPGSCIALPANVAEYDEVINLLKSFKKHEDRLDVRADILTRARFWSIMRVRIGENP